MNKLKLGQYIMGNSTIHKLDPRTKLISCLLIIASAMMSSNGFIILLNIGILISAIMLSEINAIKFFSRMKPLFVLFLLMFLFQAALTDGEILFYIGAIHFTKQGMVLGITTVSRLCIIYLCSTILTTTTSPMKLASGLQTLLSPLEKLRVPVRQLSMITSIALRFIPTIIEETEMIKCAQRSRGAQFDSKRLLHKLKSISAVLIPVLAASLQRASDLAIAMESRCYTAQSKSNGTEPLSFSIKDYLTMGVILFVFLLPQTHYLKYLRP